MARRRHDGGAAVVDFVLVLVVLVPLVMGILQLALVLFVRNTLASAASEGAREAATANRTPADGAALTRREIVGTLSGHYAQDVQVRQVTINGAPGVAVVVHAQVPALGIGGPAIDLTVTGRAVEEPR